MTGPTDLDAGVVEGRSIADLATRQRQGWWVREVFCKTPVPESGHCVVERIVGSPLAPVTLAAVWIKRSDVPDNAHWKGWVW